MPGLRLTNLSKRFGNTVAVRDLSLEIEDGEIVTLLGPSGCGKTTTLRSIAGFVKPDVGDIYLGKECVTHLPPERRGIGFVFQNYALWPHMTVYQNLAFGLELRRVDKGEIRRRIDETLALVHLSGFEDRFPRQLSGGQQQRVALARALVIQPSVLLLDEPLSNLDAQLREEMRFEVRELQKQLGITSIYVTHDQAEALVLSDRIAVLHQGELVQVGTPEEIYNRPSNRFVAGFIGLTSFIEGRVSGFDQVTGRALISTRDGLTIGVSDHDLSLGQQVTLSVRPEHIRLCRDSDTVATEDSNVLKGKVIRAAYLGDVVDCRVQVGNWILRANTRADEVLRPDEDVFIVFSPERVTVIPE
jgi:ABC-type Fe3+/spermidine/putrescine transport system ATPase subunit